MQDIRVVKVGRKEIPEVVELLRETGSGMDDMLLWKLVEQRVDSDRALILLARREGRPAGLIECYIRNQDSLSGQAENGVIRAIYVTPAVRNRGVAGKLLETVMFWFRGSSVRRILFEIPQGEQASLRLAEKTGFERYEIRLARNLD